MEYFRQKFQLFTLILIILATIVPGIISCGNEEKTSDEQWKFVGTVLDKNKKPINVHMDLNKMEVEDNIRRFRIRYYASQEEGEDKYLRQMGYWEADCQDGSLYVLEEEYYGPDGKLLGKSDKRFKEEYSENSIGAKLASAACRYAGRN